MKKKTCPLNEFKTCRSTCAWALITKTEDGVEIPECAMHSLGYVDYTLEKVVKAQNDIVGGILTKQNTPYTPPRTTSE